MLLGIERKLVLSDEELRAAFREAGKTAHPDAGGDEQRFADVQRAFALLSSPSRRVRHGLELLGIPGDDRGTISHELMALFGEVAGVLQQADALVKKRDEARSVLAKAMLEPAMLEARDAVESAIAKVNAKLQAALSGCDLGDGAAAWQCVRDLAFLEKWQSQLRQRYAALA